MIVLVYYNLGLVSDIISLQLIQEIFYMVRLLYIVIWYKKHKLFARLTGLMWKNKMNVSHFQ